MSFLAIALNTKQLKEIVRIISMWYYLTTGTKKDLEILYKLLVSNPAISIPKQIGWDFAYHT